MSEENKAPAKEKPAKQPKAKPVKTKEAAPRRRERPIDAKDVFVPGSESGEAGMNDIFRMRLAYLMNGNNAQGKAVNIQELADAVGVSRPAIRKYLKPKGGAATTPSAATVCAIAHDAGLPARLRHAGHGGGPPSAGKRLLQRPRPQPADDRPPAQPEGKARGRALERARRGADGHAGPPDLRLCRGRRGAAQDKIKKRPRRGTFPGGGRLVIVPGECSRA